MSKPVQAILISLMILVIFLGYQYPLFLDVTFNKNNSLNQANLEYLTSIDKPFTIQLFTEDPIVKLKVQTLVSLFQRETPYIHLRIESLPISQEEKSTLGLQGEHHLLLHYDTQIKAIDLNMASWNEPALSNLIFQTLRNKSQWIVFLSGHGEPDPIGSDKTEMSALTTELKSKGLQITSLNLGEQGIIPDNTETLVIAAAKTPLLPFETQKILEYIKQGGNLLWLVDPDSHFDLEIAKALGVEWPKGTLQDFQATKLGASTPEITVITKYPEHPITQKLDLLTVFPYSKPFLTPKATDLGWQTSPFLITHTDTVLHDKGSKILGPFTLGASLTKKSQRIVIIGNSHFLSNAGLHNYGNLMLANHVFNWLNEADLPLNITYQPPIDALFTQNLFIKVTSQYIFPFCLPTAFFLLGWQIKRVRHSRHATL